MQSIRKLLISFNNVFPLDKSFRDSKGILFNSEEHRNIDQIDLYYSFLESELYRESIEQAVEQKERQEELNKGKIIKERVVTKEETERLFDKLRLNFKNIKVE